MSEYNTRNAGKIFNDVIKGKNMMTPTIIGYMNINKHCIAELSKGIIGDSYGFTVIVNDGEEWLDLYEYYDKHYSSKPIGEVLKEIQTINMYFPRYREYRLHLLNAEELINNILKGE